MSKHNKHNDQHSNDQNVGVNNVAEQQQAGNQPASEQPNNQANAQPQLTDKEKLDKMREILVELNNQNELLQQEVDKLNKTVNRLQSSADNSDKFRDQLVALKADFDSYRKRMRADNEQNRQQGVLDTVQKVLPILDDLVRSKAHMTDKALTAIEMIIAQFNKQLQQLGVEQMNVLGEAFDANTMNALSTIDCGKDNSGKVVEVYRQGYKAGDKVIRYAEVIVGA